MWTCGQIEIVLDNIFFTKYLEQKVIYRLVEFNFEFSDIDIDIDMSHKYFFSKKQVGYKVKPPVWRLVPFYHSISCTLAFGALTLPVPFLLKCMQLRNKARMP